MAKSLHARLVAYRPFGDRLGVLAEPVSFSASMLHNDDGAISIEYSLLSGDAQAFDRELTDGLEVAVEVSDGSGFREPDNARFVITGRSGKTDDRTKTITYSGQSIGWLLSKAENNDSSHLIADGDNKGKRPFYSSNPGTILKTLLDENRQRGGVATGLTLGFDTAKDSAGSNWAKKYTLYYSLGTDLQTILDALVNGGGCDWRTSGRTLKLWNADSTALSRDLSKSIVLQLARDISEAPFEESIADLASTILVEGDNNLLFRMDNPAAPTPWGKWESYSSQGGVSDKDTAQAFMRSTLDDAARVRGQYTRGLVTANVDNLPLIDYHAGDWITAPTVAHGEKVRVQEIDLSMRQNEGLSASIALNDIKYDASVRQAKKIKGITGGAALAGSEGGTTASSDRDHRVPKAPQGLVVQTDAYIGSDGFAHGLATAMWSAVTEATNNTAIEISNYAVEWRKHVDGAPGIPLARLIRRSLASAVWIAALKSRCASGLCRRIRTSLVNGRAFSWPPSNRIRRHAPYHPSRCFPLSLAWSPSTGTARPLPARRWSLTSTISRWARASMRLECRSSAPPSRGRAITSSPV